MSALIDLLFSGYRRQVLGAAGYLLSVA